MTVPTQAQTAIAHYLSKGLTQDIAVGICSVLMVESSLNPVAENNTGTDAGGVVNPHGAYGLAQWNGPRQQALQNFATEKNEAVSALTTQLDFVLTECANSYPSVWAAIQTAGMTYTNFIPIFVDNYEDPANKTAEISSAMTNAKAWYGQVTAPVTTSTGLPVVTPAPTPVSGGTTMNSTISTALLQLVKDLIPVLEALLAQAVTPTTTTTPTPAPAAPTIDLGSIATSVAGILVPQLTTTLQQIIAAELAKIAPTTPTTGAKS